jgi:hypothetical protein
MCRSSSATSLLPFKIARCAALSRAAITMLAVAIAATPAGAQEIFAYPTKGQSAEQQKQDRYECHVWASGQTGYDPSNPAPAAAAAPPPPPPPPPQGGAVRGAARGAAVGAVGGAIAGDAGQGAAIGAASGALIGGMRRRDQQRQYAAAQQQHQAAAAASQSSANAGAADAYRRAVGACLQGRGYTVS